MYVYLHALRATTARPPRTEFEPSFYHPKAHPGHIPVTFPNQQVLDLSARSDDHSSIPRRLKCLLKITMIGSQTCSWH